MQRWPLHPRPRSYERLEWYVRRLAETYGVRYETFCLRVLGIPLKDSEARGFISPTPETLRRLSAGTGLTMEALADMTPTRVWARSVKELEDFIATPEGRAWSDAFLKNTIFGRQRPDA